ncbi:MAG: GNAT family N-acetyltransferase [Eubacteriales bacterium]|nr:GNAT family N-acetyltransferase [Eubacteriales bacterium]
MIRQAVVSDLDSIEEGYREHFTYERTNGAYTVFKEGVYPTRSDAEKALRNKGLYVYEENGVIMGSMILDRRQPAEYRTIHWPGGASDEKVRVIHLLMVRPGMAGKGIGSALVKKALEMAKEDSCVAVRLDTGEQNTPAVALYRKLGFQVTARSHMNVGGAISHGGHLFFEKIL